MKIIAAAIRHAGITYWIQPPARHGDVIHAFAHNGGQRAGARMHQGFILDDFTFVDRLKAADIFVANGGTLQHPPNLYSENLW